MSVRQDVVNLIVNINGNEAQNNLTDLRKRAADLKFEMNGIKKGTQEYLDKSKELKTVTGQMDALKKQIGITGLTLKELNQEAGKLKSLRDNVVGGTTEWKNYDKQLQAVIARQKEVGGGVKGFQKAQSELTGTNHTLAESFKNIFVRVGEYLSAFAIYNTIKNFITSTVDAALDADKAIHRFKGTLDNLGRSDAFARLEKATHDLQERFKVFDHTEFTHVFEQLITYGRLTEKQILQLTPVIADFASKSGKSMEESASLIIKALEGNARALKDFGINIKDAKTEGERFSLVMGELEKRVHGATDAFGESTQGKIQATEVRFKDLKEEIGNNFLPIWNEVLNVTNKFLEGINKLPDAISYVLKVADFNKQKKKNNGLVQRVMEGEQAQESKNVFVQQEDITGSFDKKGKFINDKNKKLGTGKELSDVDKAAQERAKSEREASLKRAEQYHADGLKLLADANKAEAEELKAKYKAEADDQTKSLEERFAALKLYYEAGKKLIEQNKQDKQNEINDTEKREVAGAKTKTEKDQAIWKAAQATDALVKSSALDASNFEIEVSNEFTKAADQNFKKLTAESQKSYEAMKKHDADAYKNQQDIISIDTNNKLLKLDQDFQNGKIKNVKKYQAQREQIIYDGHQKELQFELNYVTTIEKILRAAGLINVDIEQKIADLKVKINKAKNDKQIKDDEDAKTKREKIIKEIQDGAQQVLDTAANLAQLISTREQAAFNKEKKANEDKLAFYKKQLNGKLISQQAYDKKVNAINEEQAKKQHELDVRDFKRKKALALAKAIIDTAAGVAGSFPNFIKMAIIAAIGAVEIATIASEQPPEAAEGNWFRNGEKHKDGGIPVVIERDEAVMKADAMTDQTVVSATGTTAQITSALNKRKGGVNWAGGATVHDTPQWRTAKPAYISSSIPKIMAQGGYNGNSSSTAAGNSNLEKLLQRNNELMEMQIEETKNKNASLHAVVSIKEYRREEKKYDDSVKAGGINQ